MGTRLRSGTQDSTRRLGSGDLESQGTAADREMDGTCSPSRRELGRHVSKMEAIKIAAM